MQYSARNLIFLGTVPLVLAVSSLVAPCCPFCLDPPVTWAEILSGADVVVIAELIELRTFDAEHRAETEFRIQRVRYPRFDQQRWSRLPSQSDPSETPVRIEQPSAFWCGNAFVPGKRLILPQYVTGKPGDLFLIAGRRAELESGTADTTFQITAQPTANPVRQASLTGDEGQTEQPVVSTVYPASQHTETSQADLESDEQTVPTLPLAPDLLQWDSPALLTSDAVNYILNAPDNDVPAALRLPYYVNFLESADPEIASDAWGEFGRSQYEDVKAVRHLLSPERLRQWIADPNMSPERLGLYGMLLGLCGDTADAEFLKVHIGIPTTDRPFRYGVEGLMGGLMLLDGEAGLQFLEQTRLSVPDCTSDELFATVQAIQFIWSYEPDCIPQTRLCSSLHALLDNAQLCELVIANLARWQDWTAADRLIERFETLPADDLGSRRATVMYMLTMQKAAATSISENSPVATPKPGTSRVSPELQQTAADFLGHVRERHPELLKAVSRSFRMQ